jgi:hypothetical protein
MQRMKLSADRGQIATYSTIFYAGGLFRNLPGAHQSVITAAAPRQATSTPGLPVDIAVFTS